MPAARSTNVTRPFSLYSTRLPSSSARPRSRRPGTANDSTNNSAMKPRHMAPPRSNIAASSSAHCLRNGVMTIDKKPLTANTQWLMAGSQRLRSAAIKQLQALVTPCLVHAERPHREIAAISDVIQQCGVEEDARRILLREAAILALLRGEEVRG